MKSLKLIPALCLGLAIAVFAGAQDNTPPTVKVSFPASGKHGAKLSGTVTVTFADGLHGYQNPPSDPDLIPIEVKVTTKGVQLKSVKYPAGKDLTMAGETKAVKAYSGTIKIPVDITLPAKKGTVKLQFNFHYQQCNMNSCYPPSDETVATTVSVK